MGLIKCSQCGSAIASDSRFCPECGAEQVKFCPGCGGKIILGQDLCNNCGRDTSKLFISDDIRQVKRKVCPECGAYMSPKQETIPTGTSGCGIVAIGIVLILLGLFLALFLGNFIALAATVVGFILLFSNNKKTETATFLVCENCGYKRRP